MKVHIMTDMEGLAGVSTFSPFCEPEGSYYAQARLWQTREVNAAIEGLYEAGATDVLVSDGHGAGGFNIENLDKRARLIPRPHSGWPFGLEPGMAAGIHIGQHAMSNTNGGHLAHTNSFSVYEWRVNDTPLGEFELMSLVCGEMNIPQILFAGDAMGCLEAEAFFPGIAKAPVVEGHKLGTGRTLNAEAYGALNISATHLTPAAAEDLIRQKAAEGLKRVKDIKPLKFKPPYKMEVIWRPSAKAAPYRLLAEHPTSVLGLLKAPRTPLPLSHLEYFAIVQKAVQKESEQ